MTSCSLVRSLTCQRSLLTLTAECLDYPEAGGNTLFRNVYQSLRRHIPKYPNVREHNCENHNLAYHHSLGKRLSEGLGVFVKKKKVSLRRCNIQSNRELKYIVKC